MIRQTNTHMCCAEQRIRHCNQQKNRAQIWEYWTTIKGNEMEWNGMCLCSSMPNVRFLTWHWKISYERRAQCAHIGVCVRCCRECCWDMRKWCPFKVLRWKLWIKPEENKRSNAEKERERREKSANKTFLCQSQFMALHNVNELKVNGKKRISDRPKKRKHIVHCTCKMKNGAYF